MVSGFELGERRRGRWGPKITLVKVVKKNVSIKEVTVTDTMISDGIEWRKIIHMAWPD